MTIAEALWGAILSGPQHGQFRCEKPHRTLITDDAWDCYRLESLLPLKETYRENTEFGFLLRHYWIPATVLTFRQSSRMTFPDGRTEWSELEIERKMARCRSNECLWREKIWPVGDVAGIHTDSAPPPPLSEMLCSYDRYEQTYVPDKPVLFRPASDPEKEEARHAALYRLPMLVPPGPVPIGSRWYGKVGDDYMNFHLDAEERLGETSVLVIRREGRFTTWLSQESGIPGPESSTIPVITQRHGVTLFAWNRGAVIEDRLMDNIVQGDSALAYRAGVTTQVVTRLIRSRPERVARSVAPAAERR